eukprot:4909614-Pyramimonas_sp.AAC.1
MHILPTKVKSYTGFEVDSVRQTVMAEATKQSKYSMYGARRPQGEPHSQRGGESAGPVSRDR